MEVVAQKPKKQKLSGKMKNFFGAFFSKKVRKIALMTGLLALLVVTGYLNFSLNQDAGYGNDWERCHIFSGMFY